MGPMTSVSHLSAAFDPAKVIRRVHKDRKKIGSIGDELSEINAMLQKHATAAWYGYWAAIKIELEAVVDPVELQHPPQSVEGHRNIRHVAVKMRAEPVRVCIGPRFADVRNIHGVESNIGIERETILDQIAEDSSWHQSWHPRSSGRVGVRRIRGS